MLVVQRCPLMQVEWASADALHATTAATMSVEFHTFDAGLVGKAESGIAKSPYGKLDEIAGIVIDRGLTLLHGHARLAGHDCDCTRIRRNDPRVVEARTRP